MNKSNSWLYILLVFCHLSFFRFEVKLVEGKSEYRYYFSFLTSSNRPHVVTAWNYTSFLLAARELLTLDYLRNSTFKRKTSQIGIILVSSSSA